MKVYLAGPDVFLSDAIAIGRRKKEMCVRFGLIGLFPLDSATAPDAADRDAPVSMRIFRGLTAMMEEADAIIAHLTPFRGAGADPGTVYELGFMAARGKLCVGYSNVPGSYMDRVVSTPQATPAAGQPIHVDDDGNVVEDFGLADNLMMVHALDTYGHPLLTPRTAPTDRFRDLALFEECVRWLAARSSQRPLP